mmetsp:Transcript_13321/g.37515  ORF Transcript_13321/g.37515 Transcript_13321/m.37515 type:complete len:569 (-) Transcript_13321:441-2147(-)
MGMMADPVVSKTRVCIKNFPPRTTEQDLKEFLLHQQTGQSSNRNGDGVPLRLQITDCKILKNAKGKSRKVAFVGFRQPEQARHAIETFHRTYLNMSRITVEAATAKTDEASRNEEAGAKPRSGDFKAGKLENDATASTKDDDKKATNSKVKEFLSLMGAGDSKSKFWSNDAAAGEDEEAVETDPKSNSDDSDSENDSDSDDSSSSSDDDDDDTAAKAGDKTKSKSALSDMDFLRSKTKQVDDLDADGSDSDSDTSSSSSSSSSSSDSDSDGEDLEQDKLSTEKPKDRQEARKEAPGEHGNTSGDDMNVDDDEDDDDDYFDDDYDDDIDRRPRRRRRNDRPRDVYDESELDDLGYNRRKEDGFLNIPSSFGQREGWRLPDSVSKSLLAGIFILGVGLGVTVDSAINTNPRDLASRDAIDQAAPNSKLCADMGASAMAFDQRVFVSFNPFNVYVAQADVKPACVLRQANVVPVLKNKKLINEKEVAACKANMNTWAFVGDLDNTPQLSCVYKSADAQNEFLSNPKFGIGEDYLDDDRATINNNIKKVKDSMTDAQKDELRKRAALVPGLD